MRVEARGLGEAPVQGALGPARAAELVVERGEAGASSQGWIPVAGRGCRPPGIPVSCMQIAQ